MASSVQHNGSFVRAIQGTVTPGSVIGWSAINADQPEKTGLVRGLSDPPYSLVKWWALKEPDVWGDIVTITEIGPRGLKGDTFRTVEEINVSISRFRHCLESSNDERGVSLLQIYIRE